MREGGRGERERESVRAHSLTLSLSLSPLGERNGMRKGIQREAKILLYL